VQLLRPDGNVTQTNFTGGFAEIDEATPSDADFAWGADNTVAVLEVTVSDPSGTPASGTCTARYRIAKTNDGVVDGAGNACTVTGEVYEGAAQIATDSARTADGTWTEYSFTFAASAVTNWNDVRLRFTTSASGGSPANRRGGAVSWAELETPDAGATPITGDAAITMPVATVAATAATTVEGAAGVALPMLTVAATASTLVEGAGSLTAPMLSLSAGGTVGNPSIEGTAAFTLPMPTLSATASSVVSGLAALTMPILTLSAAGSSVVVGLAALALPILTLAATGSTLLTALGALLMPILVVTGLASGPSSPDPSAPAHRRGARRSSMIRRATRRR